MLIYIFFKIIHVWNSIYFVNLVFKYSNYENLQIYIIYSALFRWKVNNKSWIFAGFSNSWDFVCHVYGFIVSSCRLRDHGLKKIPMEYYVNIKNCRRDKNSDEKVLTTIFHRQLLILTRFSLDTGIVFSWHCPVF